MLDRVTITGADDNTDPLWILDLALAYPWLEFGILVSQSREGLPRYPSRKWQEQLLKSAHRMNLSMHVCGKWAREIFAGNDWVDLPPIRDAAGRIQINGALPVASVAPVETDNPGVQYIVQYPRAESYRIACLEIYINCAPLFDESGGEGRQVRNWSDIPGCDYVGYAGGIGPEDVRETVGTIMAFRKGPFWVDMEGRVRDSDDRLDTRKVQSVLDTCEDIMGRPEFEDVLMAAQNKKILAELKRQDKEPVR